MTIHLRDYQAVLQADYRAAWQDGAQHVLAVLPTGGGKTALFCGELADTQGASCAIAHRQELVGQMSVTLAHWGVHHRVIAPQAVIKRIVQAQVRKVGRSYYDPQSRCAVAGVDTLVRRADQLAPWARCVEKWVIDEGHHVLVKNKWGATVEMFPNARGLGVTATPLRADGQGLGRHAQGVYDDMVVGPSARELINAGWLCDYKVYAPQSDIDLSDVDVSAATGDYSAPKLKRAVRRSHIIGDVVAHYQRIAPGKRAIVFASDVETATDMAKQFREAGTASEVVSAKTPDEVRSAILLRFERGELDVLVNVDLFGEGFDVPAVEVIVMARPTESFGLYCQQFGRGLRIMEGKERAIIIDHVGNVVRHGLPDAPRQWSLDARDRRARAAPDDVLALRNCLQCLSVYERALPACPHCGAKPEYSNRTAPEFVDGDLIELDAATLARMRGEVAQVDLPAEEYRRQLERKQCPRIAIGGHVRRHLDRQQAQAALRESMAWWAGYQRSAGRSDAEGYRRFYLRYGVDALSAQALPVDQALSLAERINTDLVDMPVNSG